MDSHIPSQHLIQSTEAAARYGLTHDHIAALCRKGKVEGSLIGGRVWYVKEESLRAYLDKVKLQKQERNNKLSETIKREHEAHAASQPEALAPVTKEAPVSYPVTFLTRSIRPVFIVALAVAMTLGFSYQARISSSTDTFLTELVASVPEDTTVGADDALRMVGAGSAPQQPLAHYDQLLAGVAKVASVFAPPPPREPSTPQPPVVELSQEFIPAPQPLARATQAYPLGFLSYVPDALVDTTLSFERAVGGAVYQAASVYVDGVDFVGTRFDDAGTTARAVVLALAVSQPPRLADTAQPAPRAVVAERPRPAEVVQRPLPLFEMPTLFADARAQLAQVQVAPILLESVRLSATRVPWWGAISGVIAGGVYAAADKSNSLWDGAVAWAQGLNEGVSNRFAKGAALTAPQAPQMLVQNSSVVTTPPPQPAVRVEAAPVATFVPAPAVNTVSVPQTGNFVTQNSLEQQLSLLSNKLTALVYAQTVPLTAPTPQYIAGNGNGYLAANAGGLSQTNLDKYLPLAGGTITGALSSSYTSTSTFDGNMHIKGQIKIGTNSAYLSESGLTAAGSSFTISTADESNALALQSLGRVGISSSTPWGVLSVEHNGANANMPIFVVASTSVPNPFLLVHHQGYVGIGTSTPTDLFSVNGPVYLAATSSLTSTTNRLYNTGGDLYWSGNLIGGGSVGNWSSDGTNVYRSSGKVGVGTSSPYKQLSVAADVVASSFFATSSVYIGSNQLLKQNSSGELTIKNAADTAEGTLAANYLLTRQSGANLDLYGQAAGTSGLGTNIKWWNGSAWVNGLSVLNGTTGKATFFADSVGNVGIGTTTPTGNLSVQNNYGSTNTTLFSVASSTNSGATAAATLFSVNNTGAVTAAGNLTLSSNGSTISANSGGNNFLLSGDSSGLYVNANNSVGMRILGGTGGGISLLSGSYFGWSSNASAVYSTAPDTALSRYAAGVVGVGTGAAGSVAGTLIANTIGVGTTSPLAKLAVHALATETNLRLFEIASSTASATTTHFVVTNAGNVGIGTTTPGGKFAVENTGSGHSLFVADQTDDSSPFVIDASGNVGIGTAGPTVPLHMNTNASGIRVDYTFNTNHRTRIGNGVGSSYLGGDYDAQSVFDITYGALPNDAVKFSYGTRNAAYNNPTYPAQLLFTPKDSSINTLFLNSTGNVGVGSTTPFAKLSIHANNGETNTRLLEIASSTASATTSLFTVLNTGNVGIGTASPTEALNVSGNILATGWTDSATIRVDGSQIFDTSGSRLDIGNAGGFTSATIANGASADALLQLGGTTSAFPAFKELSGAVQIIGADGSTNANLLVTGNVGIGTTTPQTLLSLSTSGSGARNLINLASTYNAVGAGSAINFMSEQYIDYARIQSIVDGSGAVGLAFSTNAGGISSALGERLRISSSGNVGIGTAAPATKLQITDNSGQTLVGAIASGYGSIGFQTTLSTSNYALTGNSTETILNTPSGTPLKFAVGNGEYMRISSAGNVGIGTTTPGGKVAVENTGSGHSLFVADQTDDSTPFVIDATGNVGIGTASPGTKLEIADSATVRLKVNNTSTGLAGINLLGNSYNWYIDNRAANDAPNNRLSIFNNALSEVFTIASAGNVGIGTTNPGSIVPSGFDNTNASVLEIKAKGTENQRDALLSLFRADGFTGLQIWHDGSGWDSFIDNYYNGDDADIFFRTKTSGTPVDALTIKGSGNIGIGTTSPVSKLSVLGESAFAGGASVGIGYAGTAAPTGGLIVQGNVGIGTTTPLNAKLTVVEASKGFNNYGNVNIFTSDAATADAGGSIAFGGSNGQSVSPYVFGKIKGGYEGSNWAGYLAFGTTDPGSGVTERMRITSAGNVGIGTTNPNAKTVIEGSNNQLGIRGNGETWGLLLGVGANYIATANSASLINVNAAPLGFGTNNAVKMLIDSTGNVGIGTTTPYANLSVQNNYGSTNSTLFSVASSTNSGNTTASTLFSVSNTGQVVLGAPINIAVPALVGPGQLTSGLTFSGGGLYYSYSGVGKFSLVGSVSQAILASTWGLGWTSGNADAGSNDVQFSRLAAGKLSLDSSTIGNYSGTLIAGAIGLGTSSPFAKTAIHANNGETNTRLFEIASSTASATTTHFVVTNAGYTGIGTASPLVALQVNGVIRTQSSSNTGLGSLSSDNTGLTSLTGYFSTGGALAFLTTDTGGTNRERIRIDSSGNVGIGTTTPYANLSVQNNYGSTNSTLFSVASSTNSGNTSADTLFRVNSSGTAEVGGLTINPANGGMTFSQTFAIALSTSNSIQLRSGSGDPVSVYNYSGSSMLAFLNGSFANDVALQRMAAGTLYLGNASSGNYSGTLIAGTIGIGTSSPFAKTAIHANNGETNIALFAIGSSTASATTTLFKVANTGDTTIVGSAVTCTIGNGSSATNCSSSDARLKNDVASLASHETLLSLMELRPVSFYWNGFMQSNGAASTTQFGFIAQEVALVFPSLVEQDKNTGYFKLDYQGFIGPIISAIQELWRTVLAFAEEFTTKKLCVADESGAKTCITKAQLDQLLANAASGGSSSSGSEATPPPAGEESPQSEADTTAPVLTVNGNNPATVQMGATYSDLGVIVADNVSQNMNVYASLDDGATTTPETLVLDTFTTGTHTVLYWAFDAAGNRGEATRTVSVVDLTVPDMADPTSSPQATSTEQ